MHGDADWIICPFVNFVVSSARSQENVGKTTLRRRPIGTAHFPHKWRAHPILRLNKFSPEKFQRNPMKAFVVRNRIIRLALELLHLKYRSNTKILANQKWTVERIKIFTQNNTTGAWISSKFKCSKECMNSGHKPFPNDVGRYVRNVADERQQIPFSNCQHKLKMGEKCQCRSDGVQEVSQKWFSFDGL